jgi:MinD superfamily P-loop ATPase
MQIAVLSGKGGTGKTFVSVNLAYAADKAVYIDCDVEEPNGWLFLKPEVIGVKDVHVNIPKVDEDKCIGCRKCVDFCQYNALAMIKDKLLVFQELCHDCGGCIMLCPQRALKAKERVIGRVEFGKADRVDTKTGILNTGEAVGIPIIKYLLKDMEQDKTYIIDSPPGSSCAVMETIKDCDYCVLVAEPTSFGMHNLAMVYELVKLFHKPHGVIINKYIDGEDVADEYCLRNNIDILDRIPYDNKLAAINSQGKIAAAEDDEYMDRFKTILLNIQEGAKL